MANYVVTDTDLTAVADAIRAKSGDSSGMVFPSGFTSQIGSLPVLDTSDATAANSDIAKGKTAYVNGAKVTGNYEPYVNSITDGLAAQFVLQVPNSQSLVIRSNSDTSISLASSQQVPKPKLTLFYQVMSMSFNGTAQDLTRFTFDFVRVAGTGSPRINVRAASTNVTVPNGSNGYKTISIMAKAQVVDVT